jgi:hypothetical protein
MDLCSSRVEIHDWLSSICCATKPRVPLDQLLAVHYQLLAVPLEATAAVNYQLLAVPSGPAAASSGLHASRVEMDLCASREKWPIIIPPVRPRSSNEIWPFIICSPDSLSFRVRRKSGGRARAWLWWQSEREAKWKELTLALLASNVAEAELLRFTQAKIHETARRLRHAITALLGAAEATAAVNHQFLAVPSGPAATASRGEVAPSQPLWPFIIRSPDSLSFRGRKSGGRARAWLWWQSEREAKWKELTLSLLDACMLLEE